MAVKLSSWIVSKKIPGRCPLNAYLSSISCAKTFEMCDSDINPSSPCDFEAKVEILRKKLHPDSLIRVLDSTNDLISSLELFKWASLQSRFRHTVDTYTRIILKLGMAGCVWEMEGFCREMIKEGCQGYKDALLSILDVFIKHGRLSEALRILFCINRCNFELSVGTFNVLLRTLVEGKKDFRDVVFVYKEMVKAGITPTVDTLNYMMEALFATNQVHSALNQYRRMAKKGCSPNSRTFQILCSGLVIRNLVKESLIIFEEMVKLGCKLDPSFYASTIPLFCNVNRVDTGLSLFKMMRASKIMPDPPTLRVLIKCSCDNFHLDDAIYLLDEMLDCGLDPDDCIFFNIVNIFCKLEKFEEAKWFLEDRNVLVAHPYNALLGGYCSIGNFLEANCLLNKMVQMNIDDTQSWNICIRCLCEDARMNKALEILCRMIRSLHSPDSTTYSALIVSKCKLNELEAALNLFHQVCCRSWVLNLVCYAELVVFLCHRQKIHEAVDVFSYMSCKRCFLSPSAFDVLINGLCALGRVDIVVRLLSLTDLSSTPCLYSSYKTMLLTLSRLGRLNDLLVMLARMVIVGYMLDGELYGNLIRIMITHSRIGESALFFNLMVAEGFLPNSVTLVDLMSCLAKHSQLHMILSSVETLATKSEILDSKMYNTLINGLLTEGFKSAASWLLDLMLEKGWVPDAATHGLLVGSSVREEAERGSFDCGASNVQDMVCSILDEGLGKM